MFRKNIEDLCKKYGAEINYWYTPSEIPQPKFIMDGVGFDTDLNPRRGKHWCNGRKIRLV